jgi:hypothetical protein
MSGWPDGWRVSGPAPVYRRSASCFLEAKRAERAQSDERCGETSMLSDEILRVVFGGPDIARILDPSPAIADNTSASGWVNLEGCSARPFCRAWLAALRGALPRWSCLPPSRCTGSDALQEPRRPVYRAAHCRRAGGDS